MINYSSLLPFSAYLQQYTSINQKHHHQYQQQPIKYHHQYHRINIILQQIIATAAAVGSTVPYSILLF